MAISKETIITSLIILTVIYTVKEKIYPYLKKYKIKIDNRKKIDKLVNEDNLSLEEATAKLISNNIINNFKIDKKSCMIHEQILKEGDLISYQDEDLRYIRGTVLGFKISKAEGYTYHYYLLKNDNTVLIKPIETIVPNTLTKLN